MTGVGDGFSSLSKPAIRVLVCTTVLSRSGASGEGEWRFIRVDQDDHPSDVSSLALIGILPCHKVLYSSMSRSHESTAQYIRRFRSWLSREDHNPIPGT